MANITKGRQLLTLINVFTVDPEKQQALVQLLIDATEGTMKQLPGFVSATIHRSLDGTRVVNYAQWASFEAFEAMRRDADAMPHLKAAAQMARFDPILCEVSEAITA